MVLTDLGTYLPISGTLLSMVPTILTYLQIGTYLWSFLFPPYDVDP